MMDSLSNCFNKIQEKYENVLEAPFIYRDDLDITMPLNPTEVSVESTKKSRCLQRAERIDRSLRFESEEEEEDEQKSKPVVKPRKVVRFQLEKNKIFEPNKTVRFEFDQELESMEKLLGEKEGLDIAEGKEKVVRIRITMTKQEARRLLSKCKNDSVLNLEHFVNQIANVPVHQLQVATVMVGCNNE